MVKTILKLILGMKIGKSYAREAYELSKEKPDENPRLVLEGNRPIKVNLGTMELPEFTKDLALIHDKSVRDYVESFLVGCLYMEQALRGNSGKSLNPIDNRKVKYFTNVAGPKNPREC